MIKIGIIVTDLYDYYQQAFVNAFKSYCKDRDMVSYIFICGHKDESLFNLICNSNVDVIVMLSSPLSSMYGIDGLRSFIDKLPKVPKISIGLEIEGINSIVVDGKTSVSELMNHLIIKHGVKRIAFIKGPEQNYNANSRFEAYKESLKKHNIDYDYKLVSPGNFTPGDGRKGLSLIMDVRKESFDAVFCCHDLSAFEVIRSLNDRGYRVPEDIPVVGFDNLDIASSFSPSLTTIRQPFFNIGLLAGKYAENLFHEIKNPALSVINTQVMLRESCGCKRSVVFEPTYDNKSETLSFETAVLNAKDSILHKIRFPYDIGSVTNILDSAVVSISNSITLCDEVRNTSDLIETVVRILKSTIHFQISASFWKFVLQEFFISIHKCHLDRERELFISSLFSRALLMLYETEKRLHDYNRTDNRALIQYTNSIGDMLLTCKSILELKEILKRHLSNLKVKNCFMILYTEEEGVGELFFSRNLEDFMDDGQQRFNTNKIIPNNLNEASKLSYVISPLIVDDTELGYVLIELSDTPDIMYSFVAEKVSYGLKNISLLERMNSYTQELEDAVGARTRELNAAYSQLKERSMRDALTGLYNRRFLEEVLTAKSQKLIKNLINKSYDNNQRYGVIMIDLDHFKLVNDVYGHPSGDAVIKELGKIFSYLVRPEDYVIRLGGEEFLLVLRKFDDTFLSNVVSKIRKAVKDNAFTMLNGDVIHKTCSLGAMVFPPSNPNLIDFKSAISIIDKCLYVSKNEGRDRGVVIEIDSTQFSGCESSGNYITNNFDKCLSTNKIKLIHCKE